MSAELKLGELEPDRQAFEDHIRTLNPRMIFVNKWHDGALAGKYKSLEVQSMWEGWQAALAWNRRAQPKTSMAAEVKPMNTDVRATVGESQAGFNAGAESWLK